MVWNLTTVIHVVSSQTEALQKVVSSQSKALQSLATGVPLPILQCMLQFLQFKNDNHGKCIVTINTLLKNSTFQSILVFLISYIRDEEYFFRCYRTPRNFYLPAIMRHTLGFWPNYIFFCIFYKFLIPFFKILEGMRLSSTQNLEVLGSDPHFLIWPPTFSIWPFLKIELPTSKHQHLNI